MRVAELGLLFCPFLRRLSDESEEGATEEPGLGVLIDPVLAFLRKMDAIDARYGIKRTSKYDGIRYDEIPGWTYRLGLSSGVGSDDRTEDHTITLRTGVRLTSDVRIKGDYKRTTSARWYKNVLSDTLELTTKTQSTNESTKGSLSWSGLEKIGPLSGVFRSIRARSGVEYKRSYSGPSGEPSSRGKGLILNPIISVDTTLKNGLTGSFSWEKRRVRSFSLTGAGSVTEDCTGTMSVSVNYRFSAPQGLRLPFFGQKLKFQSNLDTSLTYRTTSKESRTATDEAGLALAKPTSSTRQFSVVADATYSFSRSVSGGLQFSFSQNTDEKRDQTRRTIGVHLTGEFKF